MLLVMAISLYTSRVVLNTLGVEDFGIYNVVGGIVVMFSFLNSAMSGATQRFLSFELGKKNEKRLFDTFNASVVIHILIALLLLIVGEALGWWFLKNYLRIPVERMDAVWWVFQ